MKTIPESKYIFEGFDELEGKFRFRSRHERSAEQEVILVSEARYIRVDGTKTYYTPQENEHLLMYYRKIVAQKS